MADLIARKGDAGSHGGKITTGTPNKFCEGKQIACKGDIYDCPIHGPNPIIEGNEKLTFDGRPVAYDGAKTACGASIIAGSTKSYTRG
ncbi:MAG: PAAR domain-containing protein [Pseudomonadota bacterium]